MLCVLRLYLKVVIFQPELREHAAHTTSVLKSCDFPAGAAVLRLYLKVAIFSSRSCGGVLRVLRLYLKVVIFQPELREHAVHTTSVLKSCDFPAGTLRVLRLYLKAAIFKAELPRTRRESNPRPRDCESRRANQETTSKGRFASKKIARRHSESADAHDLRRGSRADRRNRKKSCF